jgi:transcriptional regulator with XRE-family HTH domain
MSEDFSNLNEWIPRQLHKFTLTVEEFADLCKLSRTAVYNYLTDKNRPSEQTMKRMCDVLGVSFEEGLRQYTPRPSGRRKGSGGDPRELTMRAGH